MRYLFLGSLETIKKYRKLILIYTLCIISYCFFELKLSETVSIQNIELKSLGMVFTMDFLGLLIYSLNHLFYFTFIILIFFYDQGIGLQNIVTRMTPKRYVISKITIITCEVFIFKLFYHCIIVLQCGSALNIINVMIDCSYTMMIGIIVLIMFLVSHSQVRAISLSTVLFLIPIIIDTKFLSPMNMGLIFLIVINIILVMICISVANFLFDFYEREVV